LVVTEVQAAEAAGGDDRSLGQVHQQLARAQAARHAAEAGVAVLDQRDGLGLVMDLHAQLGANTVSTVKSTLWPVPSET
jgi:hypothetical protein